MGPVALTRVCVFQIDFNTPIRVSLIVVPDSIHKTWTQQLIVLLLRFILSTINFGLNDMETYSCRTELKISANIMYRTRQSSSAASIKVMAYQNKLLQSILTES